MQCLEGKRRQDNQCACSQCVLCVWGCLLPGDVAAAVEHCIELCGRMSALLWIVQHLELCCHWMAVYGRTVAGLIQTMQMQKKSTCASYAHCLVCGEYAHEYVGNCQKPAARNAQVPMRLKDCCEHALTKLEVEIRPLPPLQTLGSAIATAAKAHKAKTAALAISVEEGSQVRSHHCAACCCSVRLPQPGPHTPCACMHACPLASNPMPAQDFVALAQAAGHHACVSVYPLHAYSSSHVASPCAHCCQVTLGPSFVCPVSCPSRCVRWCHEYSPGSCRARWPRRCRWGRCWGPTRRRASRPSPQPPRCKR